MGHRVGKASGYKRPEVLGVPAAQPLRGPSGLLKGVLLIEHAGTRVLALWCYLGFAAWSENPPLWKMAQRGRTPWVNTLSVNSHLVSDFLHQKLFCCYILIFFLPLAVLAINHIQLIQTTRIAQSIHNCVKLLFGSTRMGGERKLRVWRC